MEQTERLATFDQLIPPESKILLVDADTAFLEEVSKNLKLHKSIVHVAHDMQSAMSMGLTCPYDIVIANADLPDGSGIHLIRSIKSDQSVHKFVIVDNASLVALKIMALEAGADCLSKPITSGELLLRIRHRIEEDKLLSPGKYYYPREEAQEAPFVIHIGKKDIYGPNQEPLKMTTNEFQLMTFFARHCFETLSRDDICRNIFKAPWNYDDRRVDNLVAKVRKIIEPNDDMPSYIKTVRNRGYVFVGTAEIHETADAHPSLTVMETPNSTANLSMSTET